MWVHSTSEGSKSAGAAGDGGMVSAREVDRSPGLEEDWSLTSLSPGQEPWIMRLEESILLGRAAGDDDGLAGELALVAD